jgi:Tripartite tricarboxylate transporter family receptor
MPYLSANAAKRIDRWSIKLFSKEELISAMQMLIRLTISFGFVVFGINGFAPIAYAQTYPGKSITVVVPFPAGGPSDVVARIVTEHMSRTLRQQMVIENVGGAGGTLGSARVAAAGRARRIDSRQAGENAGELCAAGERGNRTLVPYSQGSIPHDPLIMIRLARSMS